MKEGRNDQHALLSAGRRMDVRLKIKASGSFPQSLALVSRSESENDKHTDNTDEKYLSQGVGDTVT